MASLWELLHPAGREPFSLTAPGSPSQGSQQGKRQQPCLVCWSSPLRESLGRCLFMWEITSLGRATFPSDELCRSGSGCFHMTDLWTSEKTEQAETLPSLPWLHPQSVSQTIGPTAWVQGSPQRVSQPPCLLAKQGFMKD